jgi:hypothetical protein
MVENIIELKSIRDLLGLKFFIPSYQRGYRWNEQQIEDLLNDINDFRPESVNNSDKGTWYCLQPLVLKKIKKVYIPCDEVTEEEDWYEVIDGQQRLTTIYLIIHYFNEMWNGKTPLPTISYATRNDSYDFLRNLEINEAGEAVTPGKEFKDYIDYFYMKQAYSTIHKWACKQGVDFDNNYFQSKFIDHTRMIWYETVDEDPIKVFTRLNIGKISLTNAELIKALFLNRSNFLVSDDKHLKLRQQEIASEWDNIEYTLQNDEFWLFLNEKGYSRPTRIDFIFDLICEQNKLGLNKEKYGKIGSDDYRTFRYFYEYFYSDQSNIEKCWNEVKAYFQTFKEWYEDLELYHYVGYLIVHGHTIHDLVAEWNGSTDKNYFMIELKKKIASEIKKCPPLDYQYKVDGSDKGKCKPILLFHNIQTIVNQNKNNLDNVKYQIGIFHKFPFHLYKIESWDVEHINSNTTNEEDDIMTQKQWLLNVYLSADKEMKTKIHEFFKEAKEEQRNELFHEIKNHFPQTDDWTPEEKNRIWNYTLLDSSTNRSYGNALFSGKRQVIIGKDKGIKISIPKMTKDGSLQLIGEERAESSFVPICTKQVFMKYYSPIMSDANYWTKKIDAEGYVNDIKECINKLEC